MHGGHAEWKEQPNYAVLVDTRDRPAPQLTYVPQENIEVRRSDSKREKYAIGWSIYLDLH